MKKIVIVGGVAGGATAAARLRRLDENAEIVLLERGDYISYANCGLPYHIGDVIKSREALLVSTPEMMKSRFNIDVRTGSNVTSIDRKAKTVHIVKKDGEEYEESYGVLVLSTGSSPLKPKIPGIDSELIQTLWTVPDTDKIRHMALESGIKSAAVIGGGFIGLEVAENLHAAGLDTVLIEAAAQVMPPVDPEMAELLHEHIEDNGVHLHLNDGVASFEEISESGGNGKDKKKIKIILQSGAEILTEFVVLSIGLRPNSELAREAGLRLNERGGVVVDSLMRTDDENIYALGDIVEIEDFTSKERMQYQLAGPANKEGRIVANNIMGANEAYEGTQGTSIAKVFNLAIGMTGKSEKALKASGMKRGKDYEYIIITQNHHAGYYPGAQPLTMKVLFTPDGEKILGAQIVGAKGVDKRIDVISVAARLGAKATDLAKLELTYAPPYSSAKDPVNMAGFVIRNVIDGMVEFSELDAQPSDKTVFLDIREAEELMAFELPNAVNIPLGQLRSRLGELDKKKEYIVFCAIGVRSYTAARILMQNGFKNVKVYPAGTRFYQSLHYRDYKEEESKNRALKEELSEARNPSTSTSTVLASEASSDISMRLDCSGMQCPGPLLKVYETMQSLSEGKVLEVRASDPGFTKDVAAWCRRTGNTLLYNEKEGDDYVARISKGQSGEVQAAHTGSSLPVSTQGDRDGKTIIVFSGDMDKVMASFIIANGAAAMGKPVTMFFTFWGLSVLRKSTKTKVDKSPMEKMFGAMLPKGADRLKISKMNMGGMGTAMMKKIMKDKNVSSLEDLIRSAMNNGVKIVACTMSMDVMGMKPEELIDGIEYGGVGYYLGDAEDSNINLFI
ncbi:MAG: DsrE/DsrF/DrsH-like family protein [Mogibacterium sp.]|nr:DsrE/DsrF/DrsH-like family protein [Mogibacterium sp.]